MKNVYEVARIIGLGLGFSGGWLLADGMFIYSGIFFAAGLGVMILANVLFNPEDKR